MPVKVHYWAGRGRCEPLRCILAAADVEFENVFLTAETGRQQLDALRAAGKLAYDQVPLVEIDGLCLVQNAPTAAYLGTKFGLYPAADPKAAYTAGHVWAASQDARAACLSYPFHRDLERTHAECHAPNGLVGRYAVKWEAKLAETQAEGPFFLGARPSIADVGVFEALDFYRDVCGGARFDAAFRTVACLRRCYEATRGLGWLAKHCDEDRPHLYLPWEEYARSVRATLG